LELYCGTYFFGPLVVAMNNAEKPYALESFGFNELELLKVDNLRIHRIYPPPYDSSYPIMENSGHLEESPEEIQENGERRVDGQKKYSGSFFMYRYKTGYCPDIANKHDWTACIYAHRLTDYRRPPDQYDYSPEDCAKLNPETGECPDGDNCKFAHSTAERLYHPLKYKTNPCDCFKKMLSACKRGQFCAFYHNSAERRQAESVNKNPFWKKLVKLPVNEDVKTPPPFILFDPETNITDGLDFSMPSRRRNFTVYTKSNKLILSKNVKASFGIEETGASGSRSALSSMVNSFCSSKGLPYYTELAFKISEGSENESEVKEEKVEDDGKLEDKFDVLGQISTPKDEKRVLEFK
jgi:hypothetical protein